MAYKPGYNKGNARKFLDYKEQSFDWKYLEKPFFVKTLKGEINKNTKILDIGCGIGTVTKVLIELGADPTNIIANDISQDMIDIAKKELPETTFICNDATKLNFEKDSFDVVVSGMTLNYLDKEKTKKVYDIVKSVLKPKGIFVVYTDHPLRYKEHYKTYFEDGYLVDETDWGDMRLYPKTITDIIQPLIDRSFTIEIVEESYPTESTKSYDLEKYNHYISKPCRLGIRARLDISKKITNIVR